MIATKDDWNVKNLSGLQHDFMVLRFILVTC